MGLPADNGLASDLTQKKVVLLAASWLGLVCGLIEGSGMLLYERFINTRYVSEDALWTTPLVNVVLFMIVAALTLGVSRIDRRLRTFWITIYPLTVLVVLDVLEVVALSQHVALYAMLVLAMGTGTLVTRFIGARSAQTARFWRRSLPWVAALVLFMFVGVKAVAAFKESRAEAALPPGSPSQPNVLLIVLDALRADHLKTYGYARATSPHLDQFAREGVLYENAFSMSPWSLPGHGSLLSGRLQSDLGFGWGQPRELQHGKQPLLPEVLRENGYRTAAVSANVFWVTHDRFGRGFIRFDDYYYSAGDMVMRSNFARAVERVVLRRLGIEEIPARRRAPNVTRSFLRWVDRNPAQPFFAMLNYFDVHDPYLPPHDFDGRYGTKAPGILNWRVGREDPKLTRDQQQAEVDAYDALIAYLDQAIGELRRQLEARDLLDKTVIIITSDHGEAFGEHRWFLHGHTLYQELLHVPWIMRWPARLPAGVRVDAPVSVANIPAVVMELLGRPHPFPGPRHAHLWGGSDGTRVAMPPVFAETERKPWSPEGSPANRGWLHSVIAQEWQFIAEQSGHEELYNWRNDRVQQNDVAQTNAAVSQAMRGLLQRKR